MLLKKISGFLCLILMLLSTKSVAQIDSDQMSFELGLNYTGVTMLKYDVPESSYQIGFEFLDANVYSKSKMFSRLAYSIYFHENKFSHDLVYPNVDFTNRINYSRKAVTIQVRTSIYEFQREDLAWVSFDYGLTISDELNYVLNAGTVDQSGKKKIREFNLLAGFTFQWFVAKNTSFKVGAHRNLLSYFQSKNRKDTFANTLRFRVETLYMTSFSLVYTW